MYIKKIVDNFKKEYGNQWLARYFEWQNKNKAQAGKAMKTAIKHKDMMVKSLAQTKKGKARARKNG